MPINFLTWYYNNYNNNYNDDDFKQRINEYLKL